MSTNDSKRNITEVKEFKLLLNLLDKAEQILSLLDLSDSSISKYNTLKKMTFEMINMEYKPLEKRKFPTNEPEKDITNQIIYLLHFISIKKSMLIDLSLDFILNSINHKKDLNYFLSSLTNIYNLPLDSISSKTPEIISYEVKLEDAKFAETFTKIDQVFVENFQNYNLKLSNNKKDLSLFTNSNKTNSKFESNFYNFNEDDKENNYFLNKLNLMVDEAFQKYSRMKPNYFKNNDRDIELLKMNFLKEVFTKYFENYNKNNSLINESIYSNNNNQALLNNICDSLPEIQKENDNFHKNFCELINYIETNIEEKVI